MAANNNNRPGGSKRSNSPRYSDRYGPGHMNPYLGGQQGQSPFIRQMEERQEAARKQNEQEAARRQREQEAARIQREQENARRQKEQQEAARRAAEAERERQTAQHTAQPAEQHTAHSTAEAARNAERRRHGEESSQPRAMRDPDMQQRLRQIQEQATREAKGFVRGDEADFGDLDFVQPSADVRLRLGENDQPMVALESVDSNGRTVVSWVPVMLSEKEMESFFPAFTPVQENKGIDVQEENRNPGGTENGLPEDDRSADDLVLIPIAGADNDDKNGTAAAVSAAASATAGVGPGAGAVELLGARPDAPEADGAPSSAGAGLEAMLDSLPSIELEPEPEPEDDGDGALLAAAGTAAALGAALLMNGGTPKTGSEPSLPDEKDSGRPQHGDAGSDNVHIPAAVPAIEYNVPEDTDDDDADDGSNDRTGDEAAENDEVTPAEDDAVSDDAESDDASDENAPSEDDADSDTVESDESSDESAPAADDAAGSTEENSIDAPPAAVVTESPEEQPDADSGTEESEAAQSPAGDSSGEEAGQTVSDEETDASADGEGSAAEETADGSAAEDSAADEAVFPGDEPADFDENEPSETPSDTAASTPEDSSEDTSEDSSAADADSEAPAAPIVIASEADEAGLRAEDAPHEPAARPKHKRRRSRPTDVAMPEELAAAAAAQEADEPEPEPEQEPAAPRRTAVAVSPAHNGAAGHSLLGDPEDYGDQDSSLFTRKARPGATALFVMPEGSKLPRYIDDDDFVERWLGEEEEEDLAAQSKNKRRKISAFIGAATLVLALIGFIAVAKWGIGLLGNLGGSESQKEIYGDFVSPVVMSEVPVFETWDAVPQDKLLQSAVFSVLMDNDVTYARDDTGKFIIPSSDVVNAVKELYGAFSTDPAEDEDINGQIRVALYGSAGEDITNEDAYYVDTEDSFHVADGLSGPAPNVTDISRRDNTVTLTVEYLEDLEVGSGGLLYTREIILTLKEDGTYFVKAVREAQD